MHVAAMTLAVTGLTTAAAVAATDPAGGQSGTGRRTVVADELVAVPRPLTGPPQDRRDDATARVAVQRLAALKAVQKLAVQKLAVQKLAAQNLAAERARTARASRSTTRAPISAGGSPQAIAASMLGSFGWSASQFGCLNSLWSRESGWRVGAANPSGAYGIPQALPGSKMGAYGADWATNPRTQITWGLHYIAARYGSPCGAWSHSQSYNWY